jgi:hypothetical protein
MSERIIIHAPHLTRGWRPPAQAPGAPPPLPPSYERAGPVTKAGRLLQALRDWNRAGRPIAPKALRKGRLAGCAVCEYWDSFDNCGLGECHAPGCGCTRLKAWLLTSKCPHPAGSRWPAS